MASPDDLIYARDLDEVHDSRFNHARAARVGAESRVAPGVYVDAATWEDTDADERYRLKVFAVAHTRRNRPVMSFWSAAALHRLPIYGAWPPKVHTTVGRSGGGRSSGELVRHVIPLHDDDVVEIEGIRVTSLARTVLDLAAVSTFMSAVVTADSALHADRRGSTDPLVTRQQLWSAYSRRMPFRGHARARRVIEFGSDKADSPLESVSRVNMRAMGCPQPLLQSRFEDYRGVIGESEFHWPDFALVGESDGRSKYLDPALRKGRSLEQVLLDEKDRADRLGAIGLRISRWGWGTAQHMEALRRHLAAAGLPMGRSW
jgi:hypothetical protein